MHGFKFPWGVEVAIFEIFFNNLFFSDAVLAISAVFIHNFLQCYRFTEASEWLVESIYVCIAVLLNAINFLSDVLFSRKMKGFCYMNIKICILAWRSNNWYNFFFFFFFGKLYATLENVRDFELILRNVFFFISPSLPFLLCQNFFNYSSVSKSFQSFHCFEY